MDQIHKKVLSNMTVEIMQRITNPVILSACLSTVFTASDREEIEAKDKQSGSTVATQHLIHLLEKRGPRAFKEFIKALNNFTTGHQELALELEIEERRLRGQSDMKRAPQEESRSPPPPYSALSRSNSEMSSLEQQSPVHKQPQSLASSSEQYQEQSSPSPVKNCTVDTLIKDIPFGVQTKVENMMNPDDFNNHNWKGLAGAMGMSADNVRQLEGEARGKMAGLFNRMTHTKKTVKDLLELLKHPDVQRLDVIEEIVRGCKLPQELLVPNESCANEPVSSVEECCKSTANSKSMQYPRQESEDDRDTNGKLKKDADTPRQEEHTQFAKERAQAKLDAKSDVHMPSQEEGNDENDEVSKQSHHLPLQERSIDSEDVFYSAENHEVTKCSLLLSCCGNSYVEKQHELELRELEDLLLADEDFEGTCEVTHKYKCKTAELLSEVQSFLRKLQDPQKLNVVSFVYLVGPTMNINGENYLVPANVKPVSSRADLRHKCLNINWLVAQLSKTCMQVVIVIDGFQVKSPAVDDLNGVFQGLTAMYPPANAVIAFACNPGTIRKDEERLYYIQTIVKYMKEEILVLEDLFAKVREDLSKRKPGVSSLPLEFSLTSSLLPLCLNQGLVMPSDSCATSTAILISNPTNDGVQIIKEECRKNCHTLKKALMSKGGWNCEVICDRSANGIMDELRKFLGTMNNNKGTVMIYFIGCTRVIMDCNYFAFDDLYRPGVPLQWCLDLMCEKLQGPKFLIVDDLNTCTSKLAPMTAPFDVVISLPNAGRNSRQYPEGSSFTSNLVQLLETNSDRLSLKEMVKKAASFDRHRLSSGLLLN